VLKLKNFWLRARAPARFRPGSDGLDLEDFSI
jgi:hypothetical protein